MMISRRTTEKRDKKKQALGRTTDNNKIDGSGGRTRIRPVDNDSKCTTPSQPKSTAAYSNSCLFLRTGLLRGVVL
jgi:hypothetical protein